MSPEEATGGKDVKVEEGSEGIGGLQRCEMVGGQLSLVDAILGDQDQVKT